jgi:hypothetical protein
MYSDISARVFFFKRRQASCQYDSDGREICSARTLFAAGWKSSLVGLYD